MTKAAKPKRRPPFTTLATRLMCTSLSTNSLSRSSFLRPCGSRAISVRLVADRIRRSEIQPALAGGLGQGLDPAVIEIAAAVEHDVLDALLFGAFGDELAHRLGRIDAGAGLLALARRFFDRRRRHERDALVVVDQLRVDVLRRAVNRQSLALARGAAQGAAYAPGAPHDPVAEFAHRAAPLFLLAFLAEDALGGIFDALALVGFRRAVFADF